MHAVSSNGHFRLAIERVGDNVLVTMQDFAGRSISGKFITPELAAIASEQDDEFFPAGCDSCGFIAGHNWAMHPMKDVHAHIASAWNPGVPRD